MKYLKCIGESLAARAEELSRDVQANTLRDEILLSRLIVSSMAEAFGDVYGADRTQKGYMVALAATSKLLNDSLRGVKDLLLAEKQLLLDKGGLLPVSVVAELMSGLERDVRLAIHPPGAKPLGHDPALPSEIVEIFTDRIKRVVEQSAIEGTDITPDQIVLAMDDTIGMLPVNVKDKTA